jgi:hypothetical protein
MTNLNTQYQAFYSAWIEPSRSETFGDDIAQIERANTKEQGKTFGKFVREFCYTFDMRIDGIRNAKVFIVTPNGLPVGHLNLRQKKKGWQYLDEWDFSFTSEAIVERARRLPGGDYNDRNTRLGKTIRGLISAIKKTDVALTEDTLSKYWREGLDIMNAWDDYRNGRNAAVIQIPARFTVAMTEALLGIDAYSWQQHKADLERMHARYLTDDAARINQKKTAQRFANSSVCIFTDRSEAQKLWMCEAKLVDPAKLDEGKLELMTPLRRIDALPDELGGRAVIAKCFFQGQDSGSNSKNPFGVTWGSNKYYPEIDLATDYTTRGQWVVIPKEEDVS